MRTCPSCGTPRPVKKKLWERLKKAMPKTWCDEQGDCWEPVGDEAKAWARELVEEAYTKTIDGYGVRFLDKDELLKRIDES